MLEVPTLSIVTLLPVKDTLSPVREKVKAPELLEVGFKKIGESSQSTLSLRIDKCELNLY